MANTNIKLNENSSLRPEFSAKKFENNEPNPSSMGSFKDLFSKELKNNSAELNAQNNQLQKNNLIQINLAQSNLAKNNRQKNQAEKECLENAHTDQEVVSNQPKSTKSNKSLFTQQKSLTHEEQSNANNLSLTSTKSKTTANKTNATEEDASKNISVDDTHSAAVLNFQMPNTHIPSIQIPSAEVPYTDVNSLINTISKEATLNLTDTVNVNFLAKSPDSAIRSLKSNSALIDLNTTENQFALNTEVDISSNESIKSGFDDHQDFSKFLSSSLAKVAEMQGRPVNVAADLKINSVDNLSADIALSPSFVMPSQQLLSQPQGYNPVGNAINTYFGSTGWSQEVSQKVIWMVGGADQSATLTLNPPDLGPLQVVISVNNDKADTQFISDNPDVRLALEQGVETLREMMRESGIELGKANVSAGNQSQSNGNQPERIYKASPATLLAVADQSIESRPIHTKAASGLVDTFA